MSDLNREKEAEDLIVALVWRGQSLDAVKKELLRQGLGDHLSQFDVEQRYREAGSARQLLKKPGKRWIRSVGILAILLGCGAIWLGSGNANMSDRLGHYSPGGYGFWAIVLGLVLAIWPQSGREEL